jgi:hypothetical protein
MMVPRSQPKGRLPRNQCSKVFLQVSQVSLAFDRLDRRAPRGSKIMIQTQAIALKLPLISGINQYWLRAPYLKSINVQNCTSRSPVHAKSFAMWQKAVRS